MTCAQSRTEKNNSALQSGKKSIRNESDDVWTGPGRNKIIPLFRVEKNISSTNPITSGRVNLDFFFLSDDVKSVSSLSL